MSAFAIARRRDTGPWLVDPHVYDDTTGPERSRLLRGMGFTVRVLDLDSGRSTTQGMPPQRRNTAGEDAHRAANRDAINARRREQYAEKRRAS